MSDLLYLWCLFREQIIKTFLILECRIWPRCPFAQKSLELDLRRLFHLVGRCSHPHFESLFFQICLLKRKTSWVLGKKKTSLGQRPLDSNFTRCMDMQWLIFSFIQWAKKNFSIFVLGTKNDSRDIIYGKVYFLKELTLIGETLEILCNYYMAELELELTAKDWRLYFSH